MFGSMMILKPTPYRLLISFGVSMVRICPWVKMQIRSASSSASSKCWELKMTDLPCLIYLISCQIWCLDSTSRPDVGSSSMSNLGSVTMAMASDSFLFSPPDNVLASSDFFSMSITTHSERSIEACILSRGMFLSSHAKMRCSSTVR